MKKSTEELENLLTAASSEKLVDFLASNAEEFFPDEKPFAAYMRLTLEAHGIPQNTLFLRAGISQQFGYRLIAESKRTRQRDLILLLCICGNFTLNETQRALQLYGFAPLYARLTRDAVLMKALQTCPCTPDSVNELLERCGMLPLQIEKL